jgi:predicted nucleic acid-binding protein
MPIGAMNHPICHELLEYLHAGGVTLIEPLILLAEVAGPLSRLYHDPMRARVYVEILRTLPHLRLVVLDDALGYEAAELAADLALRGMDAIYVAVARRYGCILVTFDDDVRRRAGTVITVQTPAEALAR